MHLIINNYTYNDLKDTDVPETKTSLDVNEEEEC